MCVVIMFVTFGKYIMINDKYMYMFAVLDSPANRPTSIAVPK